MGPARSPRALGPHAGLRALACRSISALPGLLAATSLRRPPLSLLPPSLPPFLARSWPGRAPPRAAAGRTRASGKPLGRRGRSAHGAGQVRGAPGAPAVNLGNPVRAPPATPRGPRDPSELPPQILPRCYDPVCIPTWMPPGLPLHSHPDPPGPPLIPTRIPQTPSTFPPRPLDPLCSLIPARIPPRPPLPGSRRALAGRWLLWSRDAGRSANRGLPGQALRAETPGCSPLEPRLPGQARCP